MAKDPSSSQKGGAGDRVLTWLAGLACLLFVIGLSDAQRRPEVVSAPVAELVSVTVRAVERANEEAAGQPERAVPAADVRFFREREGSYEYVARLETDEVGTAHQRLPPGAYWVIARAPGRARVAQPVELRRDQRLTLALPREEQLSIVVRGGDEPVVGASVLVTGADQLPLGGVTNAEGKLNMSGLTGDSFAVRIVARGYEPFETTTSGSELQVRLRPSLTLQVNVRDMEGKPVRGAQVQLSGPGLWPTRRVDTDEHGRATVVGLTAGIYDVVAQDGARVSDTLRGVDLRHGSQNTSVRTVDLVLRDGRFLDVLVVDADRNGIPEADLVLAEAGVAAFPLARRTDAKGKARLGPLRWQQAHLSVRADGFVPRSLWVGQEPLPAGEPLEIELVRGGTIVGRVVDERGFPVEGVSLEVIGTDLYGMPVALTPGAASVRKAHFSQVLQGPVPLVPAGELGVMPGPVPPIPLVGVSALSASMGSWTTDGRGQFTAHGVSPGELRVLARHPEFVDGVSDPVRLAPGGRAEIELVLRPGRRIEGRLVDAQGFPVAQARVRLQASRGAFDRTLLTRTDGTFAVAAAPRELIVSVFGIDDPLRIVLRRDVTLSDEPGDRLELELPKEREDVRLEVVDEQGDPIAVAQVTVLSLDPEQPLRETRFSAENGSIELRAAAEIHARVVVEAPGFARLDKVWPKLPEAAKLVLSRAVVVSGRVTGVRGRQAAAGARVVLRGEGIRRETRTNSSGEYKLNDVPPGAFNVSVEHEELGRGSVDVRVERQDRDRPFEVPVIDLVEPAMVQGRVVNERGEPVEGARVAVGVVPSYLPQGTLPTGVVVTNAQGEFLLEGVQPGQHTISAHAPTLGRGKVSGVTVEAGGTARDVEVRLTEALAEDGHDWRGGVAITLGERDHRRGTSVVIVHVAESSEAERAGLRPGDVLVEVDGTSVNDMVQARHKLGGPAGSDVVVALLREGTSIRTRVTREAVSR